MFCRIHRAPSRRFIARSFYAGAIFFLVSARALADEAADSFPKTLRKAEQGDASGQNDLGTMYYNGEVVPKDYAKALEWFTKAAEQGDAHGQLNLGTMYQMGRGVPQDLVVATEWHAKAAEQGVARAQAKLGMAYEYGWGVPKDYAKALEWFTKAAEQGDAWAQAKLGFTYHMGRGVPEDDVMAYMWFNIAASSAFGDESASQMRDSIRQTMTPEQIAEGQRMSREWSEKHKPASETAP